MSLNVLVIPEDCHKDQHMLDPIVTALVQTIIPHARVKVCTSPRLRGIAQVTDWGQIADIVDRYRGFIHLFLVIVDRDNVRDREAKLRTLESRAVDAFPQPDRGLLGACAWQEIEVWVLAGLTDLPKAWKWDDLRIESNPKETYFDRHARARHLHESVAGGRKALATEAARNYARIRGRCPEIAHLEARIQGWHEANKTLA